MFQKFNTDTLGSRYIKSLLSQTLIPVFDAVLEGDIIIKDCYYVYDKYIIQCHRSGVLTYVESGTLYPSDQLYPSQFLVPKTGQIYAQFYVRAYASDITTGTHMTFNSTSNYYDVETHKYLGKYLRYLFATQRLNLFPFYNSYTGELLSDTELEYINGQISVTRVASSRYKVAVVPILLGHTYSIFVDCPTQVLIRPIVHDNSGFVEESNELFPEELAKLLQSSGRAYSSTNFKNPITFRMNVADKESVNLQRNIYLAIQLPQNNTSSIVVLENHDDYQGVKTTQPNTVRQYCPHNLSLLRLNTQETYAFSDRLLEYLLGAVIDKNDIYSQNIAKVQTALAHQFPDYRKAFLTGELRKGIYDDNIPAYVQTLVEDYARLHNIYDQDGGVNADFERLLQMKGVNY